MSYVVKQIELEASRRELLAFWRENFPGWPFRKFGWLYQENVFGPACCWTLTRESRIVGSAAAFPRDFLFHGRRIRAAVTGDFGVDKGNRMLGPALQLQRAVVCEHRYDLLYGFPNQYSEPVQRRAGFKLVGSSVRMVRVLRADRYVKQKIKYSAAVRLSTPLANQLLRLRYRQRRPNESLYRVEKPVAFDSRFDQLWETASQNSHRLMGIRDQHFLNQRFVQCPYIRYRVFALARKSNDSLVGYVVYRTDDQTVHIADCLATGVDERMDLVLSAFIGHMQEAGFHSVSVVFLADDAVVERFRRQGFLKREDERNVVAFVNPSANPAEELLDKNRWYFFEADND